MDTEKRKSLRKSLDRPGWIDAGNGGDLRECRVCDVSQSGARLGVVRVNELPDFFVLRLSADGRVARRCMIVWRAEEEVGVEFVSKGQVPAPTTGRRAGVAA
jgi:hypothetical protein